MAEAVSDWKRNHGDLPSGYKSPHTTPELARYCLKCDEPGCLAVSPQSDAVYFELGGEKQARALAEEQGWVRIGERDFCPRHKPLWRAANDSRIRGSK